MVEAAEKAGIEKSPEFELLRLRALAEAYQQSLTEKYRNLPQQELDSYYKEHKDDFQSVTCGEFISLKGILENQPLRRTTRMHSARRLQRSRTTSGNERPKVRIWMRSRKMRIPNWD